MQLEGLFEVPPTQRSEVAWDVNLPIEERDWNIGLIVGPSGSGKSTLAREIFGDHLVSGYQWPEDKSIVDAFPVEMGIKEITSLLSSVGFSSPPSWLRPFRVLSNGEQFRVTIARSLAENQQLSVIDEFTSVVDRTVAQIGSAAVAKAVRKRNQKLIAVSCHYDIIEWLQPDWIYQPHANEFQWRLLRRRPEITLTITRVHKDAWQLFKQHHYLDTKLNPFSACYAAFYEGMAVAFTAVMYFAHPIRPGNREHRTVCLPDFQGVGIGNAMSDFIASIYAQPTKPYRSTTSNPAMVKHRAKSAMWSMTKNVSLNGKHTGRAIRSADGKRDSSKLPFVGKALRESTAFSRLTASFEYVGQRRPEEARAFGLI